MPPRRTAASDVQAEMRLQLPPSLAISRNGLGPAGGPAPHLSPDSPWRLTDFCSAALASSTTDGCSVTVVTVLGTERKSTCKSVPETLRRRSVFGWAQCMTRAVFPCSPPALRARPAPSHYWPRTAQNAPLGEPCRGLNANDTVDSAVGLCHLLISCPPVEPPRGPYQVYPFTPCFDALVCPAPT
jgi:hypothetical protein